jgi:hypothetical protein
MDVLRALDYVAGAAEAGRPREVSGAIGGLVVVLMGEGDGANIPALLALFNRLCTDEPWGHPAPRWSSLRGLLSRTPRAVSLEPRCIEDEE